MTHLTTVNPVALDVSPERTSHGVLAEAPPGGGHRPVAVVERRPGWSFLDFRELWRFHELLYFFAWRDLKVRYKQTLLGASWAILQPFLTMVVFTLFFGKLANMPSNGVPYPIFSYCALLPWIYFSQTLSQSAQSLVGNANLIRKVYFPRIVIPLSSVLAGLVDFAVAFTVLIGLMIYFHIAPTPLLVLIPAFVLLAAATALGASLWLSALNVQYRDIRYVVPFIVQFWLFATPVIYPTNMLPEQYHLIYSLNPMVGVIEGFRWVLLGMEAPSAMIVVSAVVTVVLLVSGAFYFRNAERSFADIV